MKSALAICGALLVVAATGSAVAQTDPQYGDSTRPMSANPDATAPTTTSTTDINANSNMNTNPSSTSSTSSTTNTTTDMNSTSNTTTGQTLPSTASPLPLLYVSAIGTLTTGYWLARRRRG